LPQEEQILIHLLVHNRVTAPMLLQQIDQDHFTDGRLRQIFTQCVESSRSGGEAARLDMPIHSDRTDPQLASILSALIVKEPDYDDSQQTLKDCIRTLRVKKIRAAMKSLEGEIRDAEQSGNNPQVKSLLDKLVGLKKMTLDVNG
jgi:hypothetical protein